MHKAPVAAEVWGLEPVVGRGDGELARLAELQRGVLHRRQLLEAGLSAAAIKRRLASRCLHPLHPGVYLFGRPRLEPLAAATAAVIHFAGRGVLSHRTAALLWQLHDAPELPVEVTLIGLDARSRPGLVVHRSRGLRPADVCRHSRLPVTAPARTLIDLAAVLEGDELEAAYAVALRRRLLEPSQLARVLEANPRVKGAASLRELVASGRAPTLTRSAYERKLLHLLERAQLPKPTVNAQLLGMEVDLLWPQQRLVVEFDGFGFHSTRRSFERDRLRDQRLVAAGYRVIRITARQLDRTPEAVIARVAAALAH
jgi:very-short-patch-repair endonuclease